MMTIEVEHQDTRGVITNKPHKISRVGFIKHLALAGQGYKFTPGKLMRAIGMYFHYRSYLDGASFDKDRFSEPPLSFSDPTEKAQFSNLAGKAIADFLSKRIDKSLFTINYEAAMRVNGMKIKGQRPDLMAYTNSSQFAIECKGRVTSNPGNMKKHKRQAQAGSLPANFSIASVSYDLFKKVKCKYHDPYNGNVPFDSETLRLTSKDYYEGFSRFINNDYFRYVTAEYGNEKFYEVSLTPRTIPNLMRDVYPFYPVLFEVSEIYNPRIILPANILELAETGLSNTTTPFSFGTYEGITNSENYYIDTDRIGIRMNRFERNF